MALTAKKVYAILKRQISDMEAKLNSPVRYRGTVATADLLPLNPDIGDMYNIESKSVYGEAGMNVAWNGVVWDTMGAPIDMSLYLTKEEAEAVIQRLVTEYFEKNPVKPGSTTEQAQQIERNKTDIASLKEEIYNSQIIDDGWEIGTFDTTWGVKYDGTTLRARLENVQDKCNRFSTPSNFSIVIFGYKPNGEYVGIWNGTVFEKTYKPISGGIVSIDNILKDYSGYSINIAIGNDDTLTDTHTISDNVVFYNSKIQQIETNKNDISELREDISTKITKFYASSQGETHLADSDNGKIMDMMLYGKSEQKQYSGKNLLNATFKTDTYSGVALTNNGDGTYTIEGTNNSSGELTFPLVPAVDEQKALYNSLIGKNVKFIVESGSTISGSVGRICFVFYNKTENRYSNETYNGGNVTVPTGYDLSVVDIHINVGQTVPKTIIKPMITTDLTATYDDFEPYTGGIPSPNPDYPQEIKSVVNPTVKVCGKNLWDNFKTLSSGNVEQKNGTYIATTSTMQVDTTPSSDGVRPLLLKANNTYTFSLKTTVSTSSNRYLCLIYTNGKNKNIAFQNKNFINFVPERDVEKIGFVLYKSVAGDKVYDVQLEMGSEATSYEPYHEQTVTLPYTLNAIPVSSGGNVTIGSQQYVSDYVDVERGKLVRMCKEVNALDYEWTDRYKGYVSIDYGILPECVHSDNVVFAKSTHDYYTSFQDKWMDKNTVIFVISDQNIGVRITYNSRIQSNYSNLAEFKEWLKSQADNGTPLKIVYALATPEEIDLTPEEVQALKALATYYPTTNISVNSEQLDGYTVFNYPISMANGWNYVKKQLNDNRDYIYDMDIQSAEAYVNSEYAVALTELEV